MVACSRLVAAAYYSHKRHHSAVRMPHLLCLPPALELVCKLDTHACTCAHTRAVRYVSCLLYQVIPYVHAFVTSDHVAEVHEALSVVLRWSKGNRKGRVFEIILNSENVSLEHASCRG